MSKNFGIVGIVASFVFACSFLATIPAQADMFTPNQRGEGWIDAAEASYVRNEGGGWTMNGVPINNLPYFMDPQMASMTTPMDYSHWAFISPNVLNQGTQVALKLEVFTGAVSDFIKKVTVDKIVDGVYESPVFDGSDDENSLVMESLVDGSLPVPRVAYLYDLEDALLTGSLWLSFDEDLFTGENPFAQYVVTMQVRENADGNVPEPATLAIFGLGLLGTGLVARRRNKK